MRRGLLGLGAGGAGGAQETPAPGVWLRYADSYGAAEEFAADGVTKASDPLLLYFTSGTTAQPKLVQHTHASYPAGHLSTMYWIGLQPGDVHLNISSPGWAKHAWSNVYAPWNAGATALVFGYDRFSAGDLLQVLGAEGVTTFCAPPTVWRMLIQADLASADVTALRECLGAGEPLNPEVIDQVRQAWGITVRDGYGQTETTAQVGNTPGQPVRPGSMGRPLPGYEITLVDPVSGKAAEEGEICLDLSSRPLGLMTGYQGDPEQDAEAMRDGYYHTGDVAGRDADGYITYVGRTDDVFKASGLPDQPVRAGERADRARGRGRGGGGAVAGPGAAGRAQGVRDASWPGSCPSAEVAQSIMAFGRDRLAPVQAGAADRVRRAAQDDLGQDPPGGAARPGRGPRGYGARRRRGTRTGSAARSAPTPSPARHDRVLGGGLQLVTSAVVKRAQANEAASTR